MTEDRPLTPVLDRVRYPSDLRRMSDAELAQCADELRAETISLSGTSGISAIRTRLSPDGVTASARSARRGD